MSNDLRGLGRGPVSGPANADAVDGPERESATSETDAIPTIDEIAAGGPSAVDVLSTTHGALRVDRQPAAVAVPAEDRSALGATMDSVADELRADGAAEAPAVAMARLELAGLAEDATSVDDGAARDFSAATALLDAAGRQCSAGHLDDASTSIRASCGHVDDGAARLLSSTHDDARSLATRAEGASAELAALGEGLRGSARRAVGSALTGGALEDMGPGDSVKTSIAAAAGEGVVVESAIELEVTRRGDRFCVRVSAELSGSAGFDLGVLDGAAEAKVGKNLRVCVELDAASAEQAEALIGTLVDAPGLATSLSSCLSEAPQPPLSAARAVEVSSKLEAKAAIDAKVVNAGAAGTLERSMRVELQDGAPSSLVVTETYEVGVEAALAGSRKRRGDLISPGAEVGGGGGKLTVQRSTSYAPEGVLGAGTYLHEWAKVMAQGTPTQVLLGGDTFGTPTGTSTTVAAEAVTLVDGGVRLEATLTGDLPPSLHELGGQLLADTLIPNLRQATVDGSVREFRRVGGKVGGSVPGLSVDVAHSVTDVEERPLAEGRTTLGSLLDALAAPPPAVDARQRPIG